MKTAHKSLLLVLATLVAASLSCNLPGFKRPESSQPESPAISVEAADQLENNIEEAAEALIDGQPFTLTIDEAQLTSMANLKLASIQETPVRNLQIFLREGQIQVTGDAEREGITLPFSVTAQVFASQGSVAYQFVDARIGPFPVPEGILNELQAYLDQFILEQVNPNNTNIFIEEITIADGVMTISGH